MNNYFKQLAKKAQEDDDYLENLWGDIKEWGSENPEDLRTIVGALLGGGVPYLLGKHPLLGAAMGAGLGRWGYPELVEAIRESRTEAPEDVEELMKRKPITLI